MTWFAWRGQNISFDQWADDDFGAFDYTAANGSLWVEFELRAYPGHVAMILLTLNGRPPGLDLPAVEVIDGHVHLKPAASLRPTRVPDGIMMMVVWAEWVSTNTQMP